MFPARTGQIEENEMSVDIAQRVHNHNFRIDPVVRSLLDTDFYKLLMTYFIWCNYPDVSVTFSVKNRTKSVRLPESISENELREQLDHVRSLQFTESELIWLQGARFYGQRNIFPGEFIDALRTMRLPEYQLRQEGGEFILDFTGPWWMVSHWEIPALSIINELRARSAMADMSAYQLRVLYSNATSKLVRKLKDLRGAGVPRIAEFGTRRRHSWLWQDFVIKAMREELGGNFLGTSNALHAMRHGIEAIGTNAHELPMTIAALARLETQGSEDASVARDALFESQYEVLRQWQQTFIGNLLVALPDTFGSTQFLKNAGENFPEIAAWKGFREDSKDPFVGGEEKIAFWKEIGQDPRQKSQLFSDGLDVDQMIALHEAFGGRILDGYGWGTMATNDFRGCDPRGLDLLDPISVVCKVSYVMRSGRGGISAVKLSDNYEKATGSEREIAYYREVFGAEGVANAPVIV
ncbi:nicotinate phosphoribosyltransferase [Leisingera caerulea]|uniref:nicotinate phosphoribosyltransferase n=1 Tax=Leisingera caerulea TaxID=506591 RepID=UPI0004025098|nr:nicotinate phosphoribosyltransferase [Leisingera caerulea]